MHTFTQNNKKNRQHIRMLSILFLLIPLLSYSQDTIRVKKKREYYDDCYLVLRCKGVEFKDSIPLMLFKSDAKIEVVMHKDCEAGKSNDIFVDRFQLEFEVDSVNFRLSSSSSFFNDKQKQVILEFKKTGKIKLTGIQLHAPDGFRKTKDLEIFLN
ncbi:MAG: hypothetical protein JNL24_02670 [Bacteroidia bacterium]|nr:hypothetical protein [Bacteroidia bacterium]